LIIQTENPKVINLKKARESQKKFVIPMSHWTTSDAISS